MWPRARRGEDGDSSGGRNGEADPGDPVGDWQRDLCLGALEKTAPEGAKVRRCGPGFGQGGGGEDGRGCSLGAVHVVWLPVRCGGMCRLLWVIRGGKGALPRRASGFPAWSLLSRSRH